RHTWLEQAQKGHGVGHAVEAFRRPRLEAMFTVRDGVRVGTSRHEPPFCCASARKQAQRPVYWHSARKADGLCPVRRRNCLLKCCASCSPTRAPISLTLSSVAASS